MTTTVKTNAQWKRTERHMELLFMALVLIIVLAFAIVANGASRSSANPVGVAPPATFKGTVTQVAKLNEGSVNVRYILKNTGGSSGISNCSVYVQDPSGAFPGFFAPLVAKTLKANHSSKGLAIVLVGAPSPRYITQGWIDCN